MTTLHISRTPWKHRLIRGGWWRLPYLFHRYDVTARWENEGGGWLRGFFLRRSAEKYVEELLGDFMPTLDEIFNG